MINLKLAEYNKDGKFQGFLELCKIQLLVNYNFEIEIDEEGFLFGKDCIIKISYGFDCLSDIKTFYKDKKDPLKRCNGIFDGLTYGEGRFILIEDYEDTRMVHYNNEEITLYNIGSGYVSFSHGKYYKN